jgi:flagellar hook-associated protein 3 FlgL
MTRVTHRSIQESTLANLQRNLSAMGTLQEQLSSQKRINRPSDDPTGTVNVLQLRSELRSVEQHRRNADDGVGWLQTTDTALQRTSEQLRGAQVLTLRALNAGATSAAGREAIAAELEQIRDGLVDLANTQYLDRSVFAGTSAAGAAVVEIAGTPALPGPPPVPAVPASYTWAATGSGTVERQVSNGTRVRVDTPGASVFGDDEVAGSTSVFALLDRMAAEVRGGETSLPQLEASLGELAGRLATATSAHTDVGARQARVIGAQRAADDRELALTTSLSEVESIDLPATIVQLQSQEVAYKAALGATAKVLQPSLMDFLR